MTLYIFWFLTYNKSCVKLNKIRIKQHEGVVTIKRVLLLVEKDIEYRAFISEGLLNNGYIVDDIDNPLRALELVAKKDYDIVISALTLPVMSGILFTESVKNISPSTICIILTGDATEEYEIESLNKDIDLYIEKSKSLPVILRYIKNLLFEKKQNMERDEIIKSYVDDIELNTREHTVTKDGELVDLTPKEYEMLKMLLLNKNNVISRDEFITQIWQEPIGLVDERSVDTHIKKIRAKLSTTSLTTVRGYG